MGIGLSEKPDCILCKAVETHDHLFFSCPNLFLLLKDWALKRGITVKLSDCHGYFAYLSRKLGLKTKENQFTKILFCGLI